MTLMTLVWILAGLCLVLLVAVAWLFLRQKGKDIGKAAATATAAIALVAGGGQMAGVKSPTFVLPMEIDARAVRAVDADTVRNGMILRPEREFQSRIPIEVGDTTAMLIVQKGRVAGAWAYVKTVPSADGDTTYIDVTAVGVEARKAQQ